MRRRLFELQVEIEARLKQNILEENLFAIRWRIV